ncbi:hypothetical protein TraAM80_03250 [Trypanosoma rangeli]|uniref:Uncharacterized protein n=1 Tax=Trypanosoma rangeli TaxID=5698 RepID=A0A3R7MT10_TRYRA|nr:uncharacterized protein TraAM80_03250 [Trypanosoma rangeli]RNF07653.1 hypothetical protein TraAM80_03250 [Trypanosoma rangeli]|eukprot:RNF07653.1 hypothetical protein TraAM80_03250 [Trypanosoma rangeli]
MADTRLSLTDAVTQFFGLQEGSCVYGPCTDRSLRRLILLLLFVCMDAWTHTMCVSQAPDELPRHGRVDLHGWEMLCLFQLWRASRWQGGIAAELPQLSSHAGGSTDGSSCFVDVRRVFGSTHWRLYGQCRVAG